MSLEYWNFIKNNETGFAWFVRSVCIYFLLLIDKINSSFLYSDSFQQEKER
jgi:hypothetical protein